MAPNDELVIHPVSSRPVIFMVISVLVVALIYSSYSASNVFAVPEDPNRIPEDCKTTEKDGLIYSACCWKKDGKTYCQTCKTDGKTSSCDPTRGPIGLEQPPTPTPFAPAAPLQGGVLEQPPTPPPFAPAAPLQGGILEQLEQSEGAAPPFVPGFLERQQQQPPADQGAAELPPPPATEEPQSATEQPLPVCQEGLEFNEDLGFCVPTDCPEGQVLDEQTGVCVLEEPEVSEEEPEQQPEPEEEQPSEESDSGDDSNN